MTMPCLPSICDTSRAETAISSMMFGTEDPYGEVCSALGGQVCVVLLGCLGALAHGCRRLRRLHFANVLPLPCRVSRPGQAEVTLPSFPQLSQLDFAWLMNCDRTQLQGCLCDFFFFFTRQTSQSRSVKHC